MLFDQRLADRQPQAGAADIAGRGAVDLLEFFKDPPVVLRRDAAALVAHGEADRARGRLGRERHTLRGDRELDRIREQVRQHLERAITIGAHRRQFVGQHQIDRDTATGGKRRDALRGGAAQLAGVKRHAPKRNRPLLDLGDIENVVDQPDQPLAVVERNREQLAGARQ